MPGEEGFIPRSARILRSIKMDLGTSLFSLGPKHKEFELEFSTVVETTFTTCQELKTFLNTYSLGPLVQLVISGLDKKEGTIIFLTSPVWDVQPEIVKTLLRKDRRVKKIYSTHFMRANGGWEQYTSPHTPKE